MLRYLSRYVKYLTYMVSAGGGAFLSNAPPWVRVSFAGLPAPSPYPDVRLPQDRSIVLGARMSRRKTDPIEALVRQYGRWLGGDVDHEDLANLDLMLTVRRDYLDADPLEWHDDDVTELLLGVFPRKVQADPRLLRSGPGVLAAFLSYLEKTGQLRGSGLHQVQAELAQVAPRFASAMKDTSRFGMAKSVIGSMVADGVDVEDEGAIQAWIESFNARPYDERASLTDEVVPSGLDEPPIVLPPVSLPSDDELRTAAAAAPLVQRVGELLSYIGPQGRAVTQTGALRLLDAKTLAAACGDEERLHRPEHWQRDVRRMADLPGVSEAYELACQAGLLHVSSTRVRRNAGQPGVTDELARADALATAALELGTFVDEPSDHIARVVYAVDEQLFGVMGALYAAGEPVVVADVAERLANEICLADDSSWRSAVRSYLERFFARLELLGLLERLGLHVPPELTRLGLIAERSTSVSLTPLGTWWLRGVLVAAGLRAPLRGELVVASAAGLADGIQGYSLEDGQAELDAWRALRGTEEAARQIASLLSDGAIDRRQFALHVLGELPGAAEAVRPLLDDEAARPYARLCLESAGHEVSETYRRPQDQALLFVEMSGVLVQAGAVDELVAQLPALPGDGQVEWVRQLWRVDSPYTEPVLQAIASAAPPVVSKAARKALFSLRSAQHARQDA